MMSVQQEQRDEIRYDEQGQVDDVVIFNCTFHMERLHEDLWWIGLTRPAEREGTPYGTTFYLSRKAQTLVVAVGENGLGCNEVKA